MPWRKPPKQVHNAAIYILGRSRCYIITHVQFCAIGTVDLGLAGQNYADRLSYPFKLRIYRLFGDFLQTYNLKCRVKSLS